MALCKRTALASGGTFLFPDLFFVECAAILCKAVRKGHCLSRRSDRALADLSTWPLVVTPARELLAEAVLIAHATGITAQDGCYVALAARSGARMVTNDLKLIEPLKGTTHEPVWLREWERPSSGAALAPDCPPAAPPL
jgi:predicted nucleic acid-binding protein